MAKHYLQIDRNAEGQKLAIMSPMDDKGKMLSGFRIAGPKAWGGSNTLAGIELSTDNLVRYIEEYAPDVMEKIKNLLDEYYNTTESSDLVMFQGSKVHKGYRDAYMEGYDNPYGTNKGGEFSDAYEKGQIAQRRDTCLDGTL